MNAPCQILGARCAEAAHDGASLIRLRGRLASRRRVPVSQGFVVYESLRVDTFSAAAYTAVKSHRRRLWRNPSRARRPSKICSRLLRVSPRRATATRISPRRRARKASSRSRNIFQETADNEKEHAKVFFSHLEGGDLEITASYPAGAVKDTKATSKRPRPERSWSGPSLYPGFRQGGARRGLSRGGALLRAGRQRRRSFHESRYRKLIENVSQGRGVQAHHRGEVALHQLRIRLRRHRAAQGMPGVPASAVLLRGARGELLGRLLEPAALPREALDPGFEPAYPPSRCLE